MTTFSEIPGVGKPAQRALEEAGYQALENLDGVEWADVLALHGVGVRGLERIQAALQEQGLSMQNAPEPEERTATFTSGNTGKNENKTEATSVDPRDYVEGLEGRRQAHGHLLLDLFSRATGTEPVMWGPTMIGYGEMHYKYATGREGDTFLVGFSPRKAKISLYGIEPTEELGKFTSGVSCTYINKPEDIDLAVLERLVKEAYERGPAGC
ncbi:DUF1801 domain-containing protein [Corynebacterium breve]|uniref:DUF1801 domain-containing protein n=1 Tax=Corynebacterium breve TaxID=3049799 RepID=A0ABY8VFU3_9CORY|nr:DUF1801 domain-containing protein [Corynebacterium breve]WIM67836.1 DUF1801 domain-containing protein [Corynebacterium breve]